MWASCCNVYAYLLAKYPDNLPAKCPHHLPAKCPDHLPAKCPDHLQAKYPDHLPIKCPDPATLPTSMLVAILPSFAQTYPVNDACMVQLVADDGIISREKSFKDTSIGVEAASVQDGILPTMELCYLLFQFNVQILCCGCVGVCVLWVCVCCGCVCTNINC